MSRVRLLGVAVICMGALVLFVWPSRSDHPAPPRSVLSGPFSVTALDTDKGIRQFETRMKEDPRDFLSLTILGQLYARKGRESGDLAFSRRAEQAFRHALRLKPDHHPATALLAAAYLSQHRFAEGVALARAAYEQTGSIEPLATLADAYLETGRYREGEEAVAALARQAGNDPAILARRALVAELKGRTAQAVSLLERAVVQMQKSGESAPEIAWFHTRLGDVYLHCGCLAEAEQQFEAALGLHEGYAIGLAGLGDVRALQGRLEDAVTLYARSVAETPTPRRLFALGGLEERLNRTADAERHYREAEAIAQQEANAPAYYRDLALFYADQVGRASEALAFAEKDLALRPDVRAYDTLAWALYRNRRFDAAAAAIGEAMKLGTRDAGIFYHAGMIHEALGQTERARTYFDEMLRLRPTIQPGSTTAPACQLRSE